VFFPRRHLPFQDEDGQTPSPGHWNAKGWLIFSICRLERKRRQIQLSALLYRKEPGVLSQGKEAQFTLSFPKVRLRKNTLVDSLSVQQYIQQTFNSIIKGTAQIINCDKEASSILLHVGE
jgi:hypothetical protein